MWNLTRTNCLLFFKKIIKKRRESSSMAAVVVKYRANIWIQLFCWTEVGSCPPNFVSPSNKPPFSHPKLKKKKSAIPSELLLFVSILVLVLLSISISHYLHTHADALAIKRRQVNVKVLIHFFDIKLIEMNNKKKRIERWRGVCVWDNQSER